MQHVAELVHERLELVVVEALAVEVGNQRRERCAAHQAARAAQRERRRVAVLPIARKEVEVEAGDEAPGLRVEHVEVAHVLVPHRHLGLAELHAVERLRDAHHVVDRLVRREVLAQRLLVDVEAFAPHLLRVVRHVPVLDPGIGHRRGEVASLVGAQLLDVALLQLGDGALHFAEEPGDGVRRLHHLAAQRVVGVGRQAVEAGQFLAQREDLEEEVQVAHAALVHLRDVVAAARVRVLRRLHERKVRGVVELEDVVALVVFLARLEVALGQSRHLLGLEDDPGRVVADVAVERLAQLLELVEDLLRARALGRRQRHAAVLEAFHHVLLELRLVRVHRRRGFHAREELLVLEELGAERGEFLQARLGRVAHRLVGRDAAKEIDGGEHVLHLDLQAVPFVEDRACSAPCFHGRDRLLGLGDAAFAGPGDARGVMQGREGALHGRGRIGSGHSGQCRGQRETSEVETHR